MNDGTIRISRASSSSHRSSKRLTSTSDSSSPIQVTLIRCGLGFSTPMTSVIKHGVHSLWWGANIERYIKVSDDPRPPNTAISYHDRYVSGFSGPRRRRRDGVFVVADDALSVGPSLAYHAAERRLQTSLWRQPWRNNGVHSVERRRRRRADEKLVNDDGRRITWCLMAASFYADSPKQKRTFRLNRAVEGR